MQQDLPRLGSERLQTRVVKEELGALGKRGGAVDVNADAVDLSSSRRRP